MTIRAAGGPNGRGEAAEYPTLWWFIIGLLILLGAVYFVQLSQLKPLRWLKEGVERVSEGDLSTRVPVVRMDEIGQVGRAFNQMTGRVEQMLNDHDRLMADVSHELRSPLARMKLALELMPEGSKREQIAFSAMKCASLLRETMWSMVSEIHSELAFDFANYTAVNLDNFHKAWKVHQVM